MPTKAGLALYLDTTRETLGDYLEKDGFSDTLKRAYSHIEDAWTQNLAGQNATGSIFYLKAAFKYRDRQDIDVTSGGQPVPLLGGKTYGKDNDSNQQTPETSEEAT